MGRLTKQLPGLHEVHEPACCLCAQAQQQQLQQEQELLAVERQAMQADLDSVLQRQQERVHAWDQQVEQQEQELAGRLAALQAEESRCAQAPFPCQHPLAWLPQGGFAHTGCHGIAQWARQEQSAQCLVTRTAVAWHCSAAGDPCPFILLLSQASSAVACRIKSQAEALEVKEADLASVQEELSRQVLATRKTSDALAADKAQVQRSARELEVKEEQLKAWKLQTKAEMQQQVKVRARVQPMIALHCWTHVHLMAPCCNLSCAVAWACPQAMPPAVYGVIFIAAMRTTECSTTESELCHLIQDREQLLTEWETKLERQQAELEQQTGSRSRALTKCEHEVEAREHAAVQLAETLEQRRVAVQEKELQVRPGRAWSCGLAAGWLQAIANYRAQHHF
jgi:hypothetical protein